ncbi:MAG: alpha-xylosidase [Pseudopedobacter saltans]|uniref:Alpha-xylosidase n=1 Tax=Pseudopedobacter saltans TaxID=151895 RepID=A0A2W5H758_9SPHI|nr:MAG: alpha-xylosidase [Pseudopedobacter saltans]
MKSLLTVKNFFLFFSLCLLTESSWSQTTGIKTATDSAGIVNVKKLNATTIELRLSNKQHILVDFYGDNIFRMMQDAQDSTFRDPASTPTAQILVNNPRKKVNSLIVTETSEKQVLIKSKEIAIVFDKKNTTFQITNLKSNKNVLTSLHPIRFERRSATLQLKENPSEYFYGGGVQNGRFSHKGKSISIENQNSWTDGGVASPTPFYWSTDGYGMMWYTFQRGKYDFGAKENGIVTLTHETNYLDLFFMIDEKPVALLNDFYQLTGNPILLPKFGFYEGHLNAYNRDVWKQDSTGILFEDGKRYKEFGKDHIGIKESLNGEKNNYQFSARGVIDRYAAHDLPLGWILPNDGYGAGYGQTSTLDSNIQNLKSFGDYARDHGVQIGLWTQSDLHPKDGIAALLQRDIEKEVGIAGVRVLKTDVAWVGPGYSFGLNGVADAAHIMPKYGNDARPFIISLDGWAGTQRYASIWSGDQTGGKWEYIRFHIPTYIGSGLSGQPNITSDMDGIFGGKVPAINIRDFQWKTFTPMQLNMDGWGSNEKYPYALGEPATSINRIYLKLKSQLLPYTYSIAKQATDGMPIIRAMFLDETNSYTLGKSTQYQYLYGPSFLVAPIYKSTKSNVNGDDIRNNIYLPKGTWIDYFTGSTYEGGRLINDFGAPIWKLPVFVKNGAIIPMSNANNNTKQINKSLRIYELYPFGKTSFLEYDDDGTTEKYKNGESVTTLIESNVINNIATIKVNTSKGSFNGFEKNKSTQFVVNVTQKPTSVSLKRNETNIPLKEVTSKEAFDNSQNVYYYDASPNLNQFSTKGSDFDSVKMIKNPQLLIKTAPFDITKTSTTLTIKGFKFTTNNNLKHSLGKLSAPGNVQVADSNATAYSLTPSWNKAANADYYEILFDGQLYSTIQQNAFQLDDLTPEKNYSFKIRSVNKTGNSEWVSLTAKTKNNPLEYAIKGITAQASVLSQGGNGIGNLFNLDETDMWHTKWEIKATPFDIVIDLHSTNQLDKMEYLPRERGNGIWRKGSVFYSTDKKNWTKADDFNWENSGTNKVFDFATHPSARYIKIEVKEGIGGFGSGRELYIFKVPGTESYIPGDINNDHQIDINDLTSYINYTGLRKGDGDFEGYISKGDLNQNNLIDAYDISNVATRLDGGADLSKKDTVSGKIELEPSTIDVKKGEQLIITVKGVDLKAVNALSFAIPYDAAKLEYEGIVPINMKFMEGMTYDRLHSNRQKALYPTFVNIGDQESLEGSMTLFQIKFKAKENFQYNLKAQDGILVDVHLNSAKF